MRKYLKHIGVALVLLGVPFAMALGTSIVRAHAPYQVNCASVDAGADTDVMIPLDGGTAGIDLVADTYYATNHSSNCVNIAPSGPLNGNGVSIGRGCDDGPGVSIDGMIGACHSTVAAQKIIIVPGQVR